MCRLCWKKTGSLLARHLEPFLGVGVVWPAEMVWLRWCDGERGVNHDARMGMTQLEGERITNSVSGYIQVSGKSLLWGRCRPGPRCCAACYSSSPAHRRDRGMAYPPHPALPLPPSPDPAGLLPSPFHPLPPSEADQAVIPLFQQSDIQSAWLIEIIIISFKEQG